MQSCPFQQMEVVWIRWMATEGLSTGKQTQQGAYSQGQGYPESQNTEGVLPHPSVSPSSSPKKNDHSSEPRTLTHTNSASQIFFYDPRNRRFEQF